MLSLDIDYCEKVQNMDCWELADWLLSLRGQIKRENYNSDDQYLDDVEKHCRQWEAFYDFHQSNYKRCQRKNGEEESGQQNIFRSIKFKKALIHAELSGRSKFHLDFGGGKEEINPNAVYNIKQQPCFEEVCETVRQREEEWYKAARNILKNRDDFKEALHDFLTEECFCEHEYCIRCLKDNVQLTANTYAEVMKLLEEDKNYKTIIKKQHLKSGYNQLFKEYDIAPTVYVSYRSGATCEQEINKKTFINLAFLLCYDDRDAELFLQYNGYSMKQSVREFDKICEKAFRMGFGRKLTIALIDKYNQEKSEQFKGKDEQKKTAFKPMANLTKHRKQKSADSN